MQCCADYLRGALAAGPLRDRRCRDPACVELWIRPSRRPLHAGVGFLLAGLVQAGWQHHDGALLSAAGVMLGVVAIGWGLWRLLRRSGGLPWKLRLFADGRAMFHAGGVEVEAWLAPCSLRLGRYALLVFHGRERRRLRLLLGPGILSAEDHAALGRWLQRAPGGGETGTGVLG